MKSLKSMRGFSSRINRSNDWQDMLFRRGLVAMTAIGLWTGIPGRAAPPSAAETSPSAAEIQKLMHDAAWNQVHSMDDHTHRYQYVHVDVEPKNTRTTLEISTRQGIAARLIELNGKPPSRSECRHDLAQLERLASSPRLRRSHLRSQESEMSRREELFRVLAEAFSFQYAGTDRETGWIRVRYRPNRSFRPRTRADAVLTGLAGTMWVDGSSRRIMKIEGHVIAPVSFGWGILAKIYPGGQYFMEQARLPTGDWRVATLQVNLRGTIMLFKKLSVNMKEIYKSYREVPADLTLAAAVHQLAQEPAGCPK
ncbi:MAG: hypothetical protein ACRD3D_02080 [Terriglobia bacterium]